jgi:dipeptidyl aminopeptidase/acylaminoacyl peptidase
MNTNPRGSMPAILLLRSRKTLPPACHAFLTTVVLLLALPLIPAASAQSRRIELNDYSKIVSVSDPQISPDGRSIVVAVSRPNLEQDRSDRELVSIDIATGTQRILTYERKGVGSPRWSPSGDRLAFVATDGAGKDAKPQVFVLPIAGGEARKITEAPNGIEQFAWRPNGRTSLTSPPRSLRTKRKLKSTTTLSRPETMIFSPRKPRCLPTFGFFRWMAAKQSV